MTLYKFPQIQLRVLLLSLCSIISIFITDLTAQEEKTYLMDDIVVTAGRIPRSFSDAASTIIVITQEDIKKLPAETIQDALKYYSGVDIKQRGPNGIQADVSIRGGSSEQTLILIDGIKISDPQTGHHNMNLPVDLADVDRIEILKGPGSQIYGPNALAGVINIITRKGRNRSLSLQVTGGQYGLFSGGLSLSYPLGNLGNRLSFSKSKSDGYIYNTNFDTYNLSYAGSLLLTGTDIDYSIGYTDKDFGANNFYFDQQNQWEHVKTLLSHFSAHFALGPFYMEPKIFFRKNIDDYSYMYGTTLYNNLHKSDTYGAELQTRFNTSLGTTSMETEFAKDELNSNNLGIHARTKGGFSLEHVFSPIENINISAAAFAYNYSDWGWKFWPGISIGYRLTGNLRVFASAGKSFSLPTFTELYYASKTRTGTNSLKAEEAISYESGLNFSSTLWKSNFSVFLRKGNNIVDWNRPVNSVQVWKATNITAINTLGFEIGFFLFPQIEMENFPVTQLDVNYTYLNSDMNTAGFESLYAMDHLRHQMIIHLAHEVAGGVILNWSCRYENRINFNDYIIASAKFSYQFKITEAFLQIDNIFNKSYMDFGGIIMPGRWISGGIKLNLLR